MGFLLLYGAKLSPLNYVKINKVCIENKVVEKNHILAPSMLKTTSHETLRGNRVFLKIGKHCDIPHGKACCRIKGVPLIAGGIFQESERIIEPVFVFKIMQSIILYFVELK